MTSEERALERKLARAARLLAAAQDALSDAAAMAHAYGYSPEQVGAIMRAFDAAGSAASRSRRASERVKDME